MISGYVSSLLTGSGNRVVTESLVEPSAKKAKGKEKMLEEWKVEQVMIRPKVMGRPMTTTDFVLEEPEVAIVVLYSILSKKDMARISKTDDASIFTGAIHNSLLVRLSLTRVETVITSSNEPCFITELL